MSTSHFDRHRETLDAALDAIRTRGYYSAYPEVPSGKIYGENARAEGQAAFQARLNSPWSPDAGPSESSADERVGAERSPYGFELGVTYPAPHPDQMMTNAQTAGRAWAAADPDVRTGICLEILARLNARSFEMGFTVMHTTGQGFMMAFQAGGPHAQDRGLEAIAYAYDEMSRTPRTATWTKRVGRDETVTLNKRFRVVPRGIGLVIACSTFPTWNSYPALFANLVTGNAVILKPHPGAILPLAMTTEIARAVLTEAGFDPDIVQLAADNPASPIAREFATDPRIGIIDYTGGNAFGDWLVENAKQALVYTETAGVNSIIMDSLDDMRAVSGNVAFSLSLYSGQMCTTSQNIFIPRDGITVGGTPMSFDDVAGALVKGVNWLLGEPARAAEILGAIQNDATTKRVNDQHAKAEKAGAVLRAPEPIENEHFPEARTCSPLIVKADAADRASFSGEHFGPIVYIIATDDTKQSIELAADIARSQGAITCALYSTDDEVIEHAEEATAMAGVPLSVNLTGSIWVNQSAAFSDFHVSGANPAGNATLTDGNFVAGRFRVVQSRIPVREPAAAAGS